NLRILGRQLPERVTGAAVVVDEREGALERRQHPERQQILFQQLEIVEVVLVPLHHGALRHGRVLYGHQLLEQPFRDHAAADLLRRAPLRVHRGHPQAVAHARVRRRAPALTQNPLTARVGDDVLNGEEVRLVAQLGNEREFVLDGGTLAWRHTARPAPARTLVREPAQVRSRGLPRRHELAGVLIAQLIEREAALQRKLHRRLEQLARIQPRETRALAQIALTVGVQPQAGLRLYANGER